MNYFTAYSIALKSKWYKLLVKWIQQTGPKRVLFSMFLFLTACIISIYDYIFNQPFDGSIAMIDPNYTWVDDLIFYLNFTALGIIGLNGLAWAVSMFKYNVIFLTQLVLVMLYLAVYYADVLFNAALIPYALVFTSFIILILPNGTKSHKPRHSRSHRRFRSNSIQKAELEDLY